MGGGSRPAMRKRSRGCCSGYTTDLAVLRDRFRHDLIRNKAGATMLYIGPDVRESYLADGAGSVRHWMETLLADGTWADIDYKDKRRSAWPVTLHTARMAMMAIEYASPDSKLHGNQRLCESILRAWDMWTAKDLQNPNWYPNQISVPGDLCVVALFLRDRMTAEQFEAGLKIIKRAKASSTGSNLAEMAMIQIGRGCLTDDEAAVEDGFAKVAADIRTRHNDGLQPDHTLRYHGTQLYSGSYGSVYTMNVAFLTWLGFGTRFEFSADKLALFSSYVLDGQQWMVYRKEYDPGAIGRAVTIPDGLSRYTSICFCRDYRCWRRSHLHGSASSSASEMSLQAGDHHCRAIASSGTRF